MHMLSTFCEILEYLEEKLLIILWTLDSLSSHSIVENSLSKDMIFIDLIKTYKLVFLKSWAVSAKIAKVNILYL